MITVIRSGTFREGRWKNGLGVSWDIASEPPDAGMDDFGWRFALARIDDDVPFSTYPGVDRVFTLLDGDGLVLTLAGGRLIVVDQRFRPHHFPGDMSTACALKGGPCRALNLFLKRDTWSAEVHILSGHQSLSDKDVAVIFALSGAACAGDIELAAGDAAVIDGPRGVTLNTTGSLYLARLKRLPVTASVAPANDAMTARPSGSA